MGVANWFECFCNKILINNTLLEVIRLRYKNITKIINRHYWGIDNDRQNSLYVGSYGRDTEIYTSDIDMLVQLPPQIYVRYNMYTNNGQSALLQDLKSTLIQTYSSTKLKGDGQIINLSFSDNINFEVLPAFINKDGITYTFPNSNNGGSWKCTDPKREINAINEMNKSCNKNLKRLCRMTRCWKYANEVNISGILIDILAYNFISNWNERDKSYLYYDWMARDFFKYICDININQKRWSIMGSGRYIYEDVNFHNKAREAYKLTLQAIDYDNSGYGDSAKQTWRKIYGNRFPI